MIEPIYAWASQGRAVRPAGTRFKCKSTHHTHTAVSVMRRSAEDLVRCLGIPPSCRASVRLQQLLPAASEASVPTFALASGTRRSCGSGATNIAVFSVATKTSWKNDSGSWESRTDWHRCVAFGKLASFAGTLTKGAHVAIEGELRSLARNQPVGAKSLGIRRAIFQQPLIHNAA